LKRNRIPKVYNDGKSRDCEVNETERVHVCCVSLLPDGIFFGQLTNKELFLNFYKSTKRILIPKIGNQGKFFVLESSTITINSRLYRNEKFLLYHELSLLPLAGDLATSQLSLNRFALLIAAARLLISRTHNSKVTL
jgi:hypothetical protein